MVPLWFVDSLSSSPGCRGSQSLLYWWDRCPFYLLLAPWGQLHLANPRLSDQSFPLSCWMRCPSLVRFRVSVQWSGYEVMFVLCVPRVMSVVLCYLTGSNQVLCCPVPSCFSPPAGPCGCCPPAAISAHVIFVLFSAILSILCLLGHTWYKCPVSPQPHDVVGCPS